MKWYEITEIDENSSFDTIPAGTIAKVKMDIKRGGHNDSDMGWTDDYAFKNPDTGSIYLSVKFTILTGEYKGRVIWSKIGLHSTKGERWAQMGKTLIKSILSSSKGISMFDKTPEAKKALSLNSFSEIDGLLFLAQIDFENDAHGDKINIIKKAITADHNEYKKLMGMESTRPDATLSQPKWL